MTYAQNREDEFVLNYFGSFKGCLLDIGANDGVTFSNSRLLIENGWKAYLVEPGIDAFKELHDLYNNHPSVKLYNHGIGDKIDIVKFYQSGAHIKNGNDKGLVSTSDYNETIRWRGQGVSFVESEALFVPFKDIYGDMIHHLFDFISIDAEGMDWQILQQINLIEVGCKCLCIEYNSKPELFKLFTEYCKGFNIGMINAENLVFVR